MYKYTMLHKECTKVALVVIIHTKKHIHFVYAYAYCTHCYPMLSLHILSVHLFDIP